MRGQTTLDFAIGAGVFLIAIAFVMAFVPGMFVPFDANTGTLSADRAADSLANDLLGSPSQPGVVNTTCTAAFFNQTTGNPVAIDVDTECRFGSGATEPGEVFGVSDRINVTIEDFDGTVVEYSGSTLSAGKDPSAGASVSTVRRTIMFDGDSKRLVVRVW